jgi:membrane associated rhomboid family serine protease
MFSFRAMTNLAGYPADKRKFRRARLASGCFAVLLWLVYFGAALSELDLAGVGVHLRTITGLVGIDVALAHGPFSHLLANSVPIVVLGAALLTPIPARPH